MRQLWKDGARCAVVAGLIGLAMLLAGCQSETHTFADISGTGVSGTNTQPSFVPNKSDVFHIGDSVKVTLSSPGQPPTVHEERIKEDGTITPPEVGSVQAVGRTAGDLQRELQEKYDKLYHTMTVTIVAGDRFYTVDGEVLQRGLKAVVDETDIIKAIAAGGGFTDYANRKKIRVIRPNGKIEIVNYDKAIEDSGYNVRIYPGDRIVVPRRFL